MVFKLKIQKKSSLRVDIIDNKLIWNILHREPILKNKAITKIGLMCSMRVAIIIIHLNLWIVVFAFLFLYYIIVIYK